MPSNTEFVDLSRATAPYFWGIDVGGTGIKIGLVDDQGETLAFFTIATLESEGPSAAMDRIAGVIRDFEQQPGVAENVARAGVGAPGPLDLSRGYLIAPPQLPSWRDFPIRDAVSQLVGHPVSFLNDANAAAYGEYWLGSGRDASSMLLLTLGTGVGG